MSQLVNAIIATDTGNSKYIHDSFSPLFQDLFNKKESVDVNVTNMAKIYNIGVTLGNQVSVMEFPDSQIDSLEMAIQRTKRSVVEAIFGEFRENFYQLERAIYDHDFLKARLVLTEFQRKMFEID